MNDVFPPSYTSMTCLNDYGESELPNAPKVSFDNGQQYVPSQYLSVFRTQENIEKIIADIEFKPNFPIFVGTKNSMIYLQVGVVGYENYPRGDVKAHKQKLVYGREWFIESAAPTSEVLQTACLALKKAREHELREKLSFSLQQGQHRATPFNSHIDAVLMSKFPNSFNQQPQESFKQFVEQVLGKLRLNKLNFNLLNVKEHSFEQAIVDIELESTKAESLFPDFSGLKFSLLCQVNSRTAFMHELMARLIHLSDRYVEEHVSFRGFKRFSYQNCPQAIAQFSLKTRLFDLSDQTFWNHFEKMTYSVDSNRVPPISDSQYGKRIQQSLASFGELAGYLPESFASV